MKTLRWCRLYLAQVPARGQLGLQFSPAPLAKSCLGLHTSPSSHEGSPSDLQRCCEAKKGRGGDSERPHNRSEAATFLVLERSSGRHADVQ